MLAASLGILRRGFGVVQRVLLFARAVTAVLREVYVLILRSGVKIVYHVVKTLDRRGGKLYLKRA